MSVSLQVSAPGFALLTLPLQMPTLLNCGMRITIIEPLKAGGMMVALPMHLSDLTFPAIVLLIT
jgi:hypothetical protein